MLGEKLAFALEQQLQNHTRQLVWSIGIAIFLIVAVIWTLVILGRKNLTADERFDRLSLVTIALIAAMVITLVFYPG